MISIYEIGLKGN